VFFPEDWLAYCGELALLLLLTFTVDLDAGLTTGAGTGCVRGATLDQREEEHK